MPEALDKIGEAACLDGLAHLPHQNLVVMKIVEGVQARTKEILGARLNTLHNLHYYQVLMREMREAIEAGSFADFVERFRHGRAAGNPAALASSGGGETGSIC